MWPGPEEYLLAVKNPVNHFDDPVLKKSNPKTDNRGSPKFIAGNFALAFEFTNGAHQFAIRCFIRESASRQRKYEQLSHYLKQISIPYLVNFEYISKGILIHGNWFPILKMDWIDGDTLESFVANNLNKPNKLRELARKFRLLVGALNTKCIAHGDLQHGNILITKSDDLFLVDYDDFFIPAFLGEASSELGHPNYQHPLRNATFYDDRIDNFSALILYLSVLGIADNPNLWKEYHDDEYLILNRHDFECPSVSSCLQRLKQSRDHTISRLTKYVDRFCREEPTNVPPIDNIIQGQVPDPAPPIFNISIPQINQQVMSGDALNLIWNGYNIYDNIFFELAQGNVNPKVLLSSPIIYNKAGSNRFTLNLPSKLPSSNDCRIRVSLSQSKQPVYYSKFFNIVHSNKPVLKLQSPKAGDTLIKRAEYPIKWYFENLPGKIRIELLFADKLHRTLTEIAEPGSNNQGSFYWKVPIYDTRNRYKIRLVSTADSSISDISDFFIICGEKFTLRFLLFQQNEVGCQ